MAMSPGLSIGGRKQISLRGLRRVRPEEGSGEELLTAEIAEISPRTQRKPGLIFNLSQIGTQNAFLCDLRVASAISAVKIFSRCHVPLPPTSLHARLRFIASSVRACLNPLTKRVWRMNYRS